MYMDNFLNAFGLVLAVSLVTASPFELFERQNCPATCCLSGFVVVDGEQIAFNNVQQPNAAARAGGATTSAQVTGILNGCTIGVAEACQCADWSVTTTSGCGTSRTVTFSSCGGGGGGGGGGRPGGPGRPGKSVRPGGV